MVIDCSLMSPTDQDFATIDSVEYGIRLPNGQEIWPPDLFKGRAKYQTVEERAVILVAIAQGLDNMFLQRQDLDRYKWVSRQKTVHQFISHADLEVHDFDDPNLVEPPPSPETEAEVVDSDSFEEPPLDVGTQDPEEV